MTTKLTRDLLRKDITREARLQVGNYVQHFKRADYIKRHVDNGEYLYKILAIAEHTETKEPYVIYVALYTNASMGVSYGDVFARPYSMFMSKVDTFKYPHASQEYRFERV